MTITRIIDSIYRISNIRKNLIDIGVKAGRYTVAYNLFRNIFGNSKSGKAYVGEISPSRKEIRLKRNPPGSQGISEPQQSIIIDKLNEGQLSYNFNSFIELDKLLFELMAVSTAI